MGTTYSTGQIAKRLGKTVRTIQQWDKDKKLVAKRTPTGRRFYTEDQILSFLGVKKEAVEKKSVAYCRVSSHAQKPDLVNQRKVLEDFCAAKGISNIEFIEEVGGGMNFKRKKFCSLMEDVHNQKIGTIVIAHKDRLVRFGFDYIKWDCEKAGCNIFVLNSEQLSPETEMVQDLMTIIHCFSSRLYGLRNYKKELKKALK